MTTCRYAWPGAGDAAGPGTSQTGAAEGCSFSRRYFLALRVPGSVFRPAFSRISFAFQAGETSGSFSWPQEVGQISAVSPLSCLLGGLVTGMTLWPPQWAPVLAPWVTELRRENYSVDIFGLKLLSHSRGDPCPDYGGKDWLRYGKTCWI